MTLLALPAPAASRWDAGGEVGVTSPIRFGLLGLNAAGMTTLKADLTGGGSQTTEWVYGITTGGGNGLTSNDIVGITKWPDKSTGAASTSEEDVVTVDALGATKTATDRNGNVHTLSYDVLGRVTADAVTTLGSGVDGSVRRIETAYDGQGNAFLITSYDAASGGSIVNQVQRTFNGLGQLTTEYQSHSGAVNTSTSPKVQYAYSEMPSGANHSRLTSMTYPNGRVITYDYGTSAGLNDTISRLAAIKDGSTTLEAYDYLGLGSVVRMTHPQPGVDLTYIKQSGESNGDAGDQYIGLDRFGRVVDQRWITTSSGAAVDRYQYGYDRDGNRLYRDNLVNTALGELYTYDGLNQVASFSRGTLNSGKTAISGTASRTQSWGYDALGNWTGLTTNGTADTRTNNKQNELTAIGSNSLTYDNNGNQTTDQTGKQFVWDAWNRLVTVKNSGGTTIETHAYDGRNFRVSSTASSITTDLYYSAGWQVVEERVSGTATTSYVWSPVYVDAMIARDRDTDANGSLDERLYPTRDANFNVTGLLNTSGTVVERNNYDPFGVVTVMSSAWVVQSSSSVGWVYWNQGTRWDGVAEKYYVRARWFDPDQGRWISTDPEIASNNTSSYLFTDNSPIAYIDYNGLQKMTSDDKVNAFIETWMNAYSYNARITNGELKPIAGVNGKDFPATGSLGDKACDINFTFKKAYAGIKKTKEDIGIVVAINADLSKCPCACDKLKWIQLVRRFKEVNKVRVPQTDNILVRNQRTVGWNPNTGKLEGTGEEIGWRIDTDAEGTNPFYGDEPAANSTLRAVMSIGTERSVLRDGPDIAKTGGTNIGKDFYSLLVCIKAGQPIKILGGIQWGFIYDGTNVTMDTPKVITSIPQQFGAAVIQWNGITNNQKIEYGK